MVGESNSLEFATVDNFDFFDWPIVPADRISLDLLAVIKALEHLAEDNVLAVKPLCVDEADKKLRAVGVGASVRHGQAAREVLELKVLVFKLRTVNGLAASSIAVREVTSLHHEIGDDTMEARALETEALLPRTKGAEVFDGLWYVLTEEPDGHTLGSGPTDGDVEVHFCGDFWLAHFARGRGGNFYKQEWCKP